MNFLAKFKYSAELILLIAFAFMIMKIDLSWFNTHMSRDLFRATEWLRGAPDSWLGPEMGWDYKRLPGPAYYWLLAPLLLPKSVTFILILKIILLFCILFFLAREIRRQFPQLLTDFLLLFALMPVFIFTSRNLWNPSNIILINCLQLLLLFKIHRHPTSLKILMFSLFAAVGMQMHFSTMLIYFSGGLAILLTKVLPQKLKLLQTAGFGLLILWLAVWYFLNRVPEFDQQLKQFYGLNAHLLSRLSDLRSHLSYLQLELLDYDLFSQFTRSLSALGLYDLYLSNIFRFLNLLFTILFFLSLGLVGRGAYKDRDLLKIFLVLHSFLFIVSILVFQSKENVPYRYGLSLYPVQFFIMSYGLNFWRSKIKIGRLTCVGVFILYGFFNFKMYQASEITGRAAHTNNDNLELNLKNKLYLYNFIKAYSQPGEDPFTHLHGRTANKFRLKEMNWEQQTAYFSLYWLTTGNTVDLHQAVPASGSPAWLLQLKNIAELQLDPTSAFTLREMKPADFPQDLKIQARSWPLSQYILPLAESADFESINLDFTLKRETSGYLNVLTDSNSDYEFAYPAIFKTVAVTINGVHQEPIAVYKGYFLVQNQQIYKLDRSGEFKIEVKLGSGSHTKNYSRVDIFATDDLLPQEELFPKR